MEKESKYDFYNKSSFTSLSLVAALLPLFITVTVNVMTSGGTSLQKKKDFYFMLIT